jgi:hypothetical protein
MKARMMAQDYKSKYQDVCDDMFEIRVKIRRRLLYLAKKNPDIIVMGNMKAREITPLFISNTNDPRLCIYLIERIEKQTTKI